MRESLDNEEFRTFSCTTEACRPTGSLDVAYIRQLVISCSESCKFANNITNTRRAPQLRSYFRNISCSAAAANQELEDGDKIEGEAIETPELSSTDIKKSHQHSCDRSWRRTISQSRTKH